FSMVGNLREQAGSVGAAAFTENDGLEAQSAADGFFDQANTFNRQRAVTGGLSVGKRLAQLLYQRVLPAGYLTQACGYILFHGHWPFHHTGQQGEDFCSCWFILNGLSQGN